MRPRHTPLLALIAAAAISLFTPTVVEARPPKWSVDLHKDPVTDCWVLTIDLHLLDSAATSFNAFRLDLDYDPAEVTLNHMENIAPFQTTIGGATVPGYLTDITGESTQFVGPDADLVRIIFDNVVPNSIIPPYMLAHMSSNDYVVTNLGPLGPGDVEPTAVPEPGSAALALLAVPAFLRRRRTATAR